VLLLASACAEPLILPDATPDASAPTDTGVIDDMSAAEDRVDPLPDASAPDSEAPDVQGMDVPSQPDASLPDVVAPPVDGSCAVVQPRRCSRSREHSCPNAA
jgi:hypothetical protein